MDCEMCPNIHLPNIEPKDFWFLEVVIYYTITDLELIKIVSSYEVGIV